MTALAEQTPEHEDDSPQAAGTHAHPVAVPAPRSPANQGPRGDIPAEVGRARAEEAAEQLAAAVTAALRPDTAPLDYAPVREGVLDAVRCLRGALLDLIRELGPKTGVTSPDSAIARAQHLAGDIRFARPFG